MLSFLAALVLIGVLVIVHEAGHFLAAKACGIQVTEFSVGFGRRLFGVRVGGTDYRLSLLPFGGYVKMAGADAFGAWEDTSGRYVDPRKHFSSKPVSQRLFVSVAGPAMNLLLPLVVFTVLLMWGEPQAAPDLGLVSTSDRVAAIGIRSGDRVLAIDGVPLLTYGELLERSKDLTAGPHELSLLRDGAPTTLRFTHDPAQHLDWSTQRPDATLGVSDPRSPAARAGLMTGDVITAIDGVAVHDWLDVGQGMARAGATVEVAGVHGDHTPFRVTLSQDPAWAPLATGVALGPEEMWGLSSATLFVGSLLPEVGDGGGLLGGCAPGPAAPPSPAVQAGLRQGDRFYKADGRPVQGWQDVIDAVSGAMVGEGAEATARALTLEVVREGRVLSFELTPEVIEDTDALGRFYHRPIVGVTRLGSYVGGDTVRRYYPFPDAVVRATEETTLLAGFVVEQVGKLLTREAAVQKSLGGPFEMGRQAAKAAEEGIFAWARLLGGLSISLGIVNLLPVPVLDGGAILFYLIELVRGRPVSVVLRERAQQVGVIFLVLLMVTVSVSDLFDWFQPSP